jgi:ATP-dependent Clp protease, protease subunit
MSKLFTLRKAESTAFKASAAEGDLVLEMYDVIGADFFGEGITAQSVSDALANAGVFNSVTCRINSPGGDLFEGVSIYNVLKSSGKPVNVIVDGMAASAASLIAMAGDKVTMGTGTLMMIHRAMAMTAGFADDMRKMAETLDKVSDSAADLYVAKTGLKKDEILSMMAEETWLSAQDCVDKGFANAVSQDEAKISNAFDLSVFKNTPEALKVAPEPAMPEPAVDDSAALVAILAKRLEILRRK